MLQASARTSVVIVIRSCADFGIIKYVSSVRTVSIRNVEVLSRQKYATKRGVNIEIVISRYLHVVLTISMEINQEVSGRRKWITSNATSSDQPTKSIQYCLLHILTFYIFFQYFYLISTLETSFYNNINFFINSFQQIPLKTPVIVFLNKQALVAIFWHYAPKTAFESWRYCHARSE